ncbi:MAG: RrF2 family transcriptional regulator [Solirubrobacterales bacterium]
MQITRQTEYAIRTMLELAASPGQILSTKVISERQDVPELFLKKTVQILARAGLVTTQRGTQGGVRLARSGDTITIADIVIAVEGPLALNVCLMPGHICGNLDTCVVHQIMNRAQNALSKELSRDTLTDILKMAEKQKVGV